MDSETCGLLRDSASVGEPSHGSDAHVPLGANDRTSPFTTTSIQRIESNDADDYCERVSDWNVRFTHLRPGPFAVSATIIPLGRLWIGRSCLNKPMVHHNTLPQGTIVIARPGRGSDPQTYQGHELQDDEVFVGGREAEFEVVNRGVLYSTILMIGRDSVENESDWLAQSTQLTSIGGVRVHTPGEHWATAFLSTMEWLLDAVERYADAIARPEVRDSLGDQVLARVNTVGVTNAPISDDRQMKAHRRVAVERARDYINRNLCYPIRLSDLSKHAHTQARSLEYGFREVLGVSPMAYVRAMRLHRARHLLRTTAVRTRSVSEIAMDCGFWHLSQFAVDYRALFNESPSVTHRCTQAQLPRHERRKMTTVDAKHEVRIRSTVPVMR